jgi:hypothetical protein
MPSNCWIHFTSYGDDKALQEVLLGESRSREVLEELFNDERLNFT